MKPGYLVVGSGMAVSLASVNPPVNLIAMNHTETFQREIARLTVEVDDFIVAGCRQVEAASHVYRELGAEIHDALITAGQALSLDERQACEAFVEKHIRQCQSKPGSVLGNLAGELMPGGRTKTPVLKHPAGRPLSSKAGKTHRFI